MKLFSLFKNGFKKTKTHISRGFEKLFTDVKIWDESTYKQLEKTLLSADLGVAITRQLVATIKEKYQFGEIKTSTDISNIAQKHISNILGENTPAIKQNSSGTTVILMVGVNGSGKTTTTGKLAYKFKQEGKSVMLAACDTFRAAAIQQLQLWGKKIGVEVVASSYGTDAASVAFTAMQKAQKENIDYLLIDTAGRQHTQQNLMQELEKINRVIKKADENNPAYRFLVIDGSTGTNALLQVRKFSEICNLNGLCITKLDGSSKAGVIVSIKNEKDIPVYFVGLGEKSQDLQPFEPQWYTKAIFSKEE